MTNINKRLDGIDGRLNSIDGRLDGIDGHLDKLEKSCEDIYLTIENEIRPNIGAVAEAHLILNRKLDEALKVEEDKELMKIRLTRLENEVRRIAGRPI
ncbi:MAG: hypothetical protein K6F86_11605 [Lachnospiraceae bacterium]|nr:hypothetical protein [Lachnospiraceae bacterium]